MEQKASIQCETPIQTLEITEGLGQHDFDAFCDEQRFLNASAQDLAKG